MFQLEFLTDITCEPKQRSIEMADSNMADHGGYKIHTYVLAIHLHVRTIYVR